MGTAGPIGLDDKSIIAAMEAYFKVKKNEKLELSLTVRRFSKKVLKIVSEIAERQKPNG